MINISNDEVERLMFNSDDEVVIPDIEGGSDELGTDGIERAIQGESLKNVLLDEVDKVKVPSYLIDLSNVSVAKAVFMAIKGLLGGGNTGVYIKEGSGSIILVGYGDEYILYTVLEDIIRGIYGNKDILYKNNGKGFKLISSMDVSSERLDI